jgi:hypothetical protein
MSSNTTEFLSSITGESADSFGKAANAIGSLAGMLADWGGAIGFIGMIGGLFGQEDSLQTVVSEIVSKAVDTLESDLAEKDTLDLARDMATKLGHAESALDFVKQAATEKRQLTDQESTRARGDTSEVVKALLREDYWYRLFDADAVYIPYKNRWDVIPQLQLDPRDSKDAKKVFEYRYTLPAFLEAITLRLIVLGATMPLSEPQVQDELGAIVKRLVWVHDKIGAAIVSLPLVPLGVWNLPYPFGAVEEFSAHACVNVWNWDKCDYREVTWLQRFPAILAIRTLAHRKKVYSDVGLPAVFNTISHLRQLLRDSRGLPFAIPRWNPNVDWSLHEVDSAIVATTAFNNINIHMTPDSATWMDAKNACVSAIATTTTFDDAVAKTTPDKPSTTGQSSIRRMLWLMREDVLPVRLVEAFNTV